MIQKLASHFPSIFAIYTRFGARRKPVGTLRRTFAPRPGSVARALWAFKSRELAPFQLPTSCVPPRRAVKDEGNPQFQLLIGMLRRTFEPRPGSVARALGAQNRASWLYFQGIALRPGKPCRTMETLNFSFLSAHEGARLGPGQLPWCVL